jgi:hypothetical protein
VFFLPAPGLLFTTDESTNTRVRTSGAEKAGR